MTWGAMTWEDSIYRHNPHDSAGGERNVSVHYPKYFDNTNGLISSRIFYDSQPDWYTATIPRTAIPTDLTGDQISRNQISDSV